MIGALVLAVSPGEHPPIAVRLVARGGRRRRAGFGSAVRRSVPIRTFGDWNDSPPGLCRGRFRRACWNISGRQLHSDDGPDGHWTGWTECVPVVVRNGGLVIEALAAAMALFPFPLRGVDFDNDGSFMNDPVVDWCRARGLEVTRSRAHRKNDQAHVEQKNGAIVRRLVGYGRFEGLGAAQALARLFAAAPAHQPVSAVLQAEAEEAHRGPRHQTLPSAGAAGRSCACSCSGRRRSQGPAARAPREGGSGSVIRRDPRGSGRARRTG